MAMSGTEMAHGSKLSKATKLIAKIVKHDSQAEASKGASALLAPRGIRIDVLYFAPCPL